MIIVILHFRKNLQLNQILFSIMRKKNFFSKDNILWNMLVLMHIRVISNSSAYTIFSRPYLFFKQLKKFNIHLCYDLIQLALRKQKICILGRLRAAKNGTILLTFMYNIRTYRLSCKNALVLSQYLYNCIDIVS